MSVNDMMRMQEVQRRMRTPTSRDNLDLIASDPQARMSGLQAFRGGPEEGTGIPSRMPVPVPAGPTGSPSVPLGSPQVGPMGSPQTGPTGSPLMAGMGGSPVAPTGGLSMAGTQAPMAPPTKKSLHIALTMSKGDEDSVSLTALEKLIDKSHGNKLINNMVAQTRGIEDSTIGAYTGGGLMQLAAGGEFRGRVPGDGHGMEDNVYMPIREGVEEVGTLAVSPSEYVVDSYTMAALGNGNADEGAEIMDEVVEGVRERAYGNRQQPNEINGLAALRPMLERV